MFRYTLLLIGKCLKSVLNNFGWGKTNINCIFYELPTTISTSVTKIMVNPDFNGNTGEMYMGIFLKDGDTDPRPYCVIRAWISGKITEQLMVWFHQNIWIKWIVYFFSDSRLSFALASTRKSLSPPEKNACTCSESHLFESIIITAHIERRNAADSNRVTEWVSKVSTSHRWQTRGHGRSNRWRGSAHSKSRGSRRKSCRRVTKLTATRCQTPGELKIVVARTVTSADHGAPEWATRWRTNDSRLRRGCDNTTTWRVTGVAGPAVDVVETRAPTTLGRCWQNRWSVYIKY